MHSTTGVCRMSESVLCHMCVFSRLSRLKWFVLATKNARHHRCVKDVRNFSLCENTLVSYIYITTQFSHHTQRMHSITGVCRMSESFICTRIHMYHTCISPPPFSHTIRVYSHTILPKWEKKNIRREYTSMVWDYTSESEREKVCVQGDMYIVTPFAHHTRIFSDHTLKISSLQCRTYSPWFVLNLSLICP